MIGLLFARMLRSLPLVIFLVILAVIVYFVVMYRSSPNHAKEVLIRMFTVIGSVLSGFFALICVYAFAEHNDTAFDFSAGFLVVSLLTLIIARICRAVFLKHNPKYKQKPTKTSKSRRMR
ncbi:MAG: guanylate cyclase [Raoultibacter sp.]